MFLPVIHDLLKPQWLAILTELKLADGLAIPELARRLGQSYMTLKQHCEHLAKLGYLQRLRVPRTEIGRPEIFYRITPKAEGLFPSIPGEFTLEMLDQSRQLFGETAPERLLFQYFQKQEGVWKGQLEKAEGLADKVARFARIREKEGLFVKVLKGEGDGLVLRIHHHPLRAIFEVFPSAVAMETRAMEAIFGTRIGRVANSHGQVDFQFPQSG